MSCKHHFARKPGDDNVVTVEGPGERGGCVLCWDAKMLDHLRKVALASHELVGALGVLHYATHCPAEQHDECERVVKAEEALTNLLSESPR